MPALRTRTVSVVVLVVAVLAVAAVLALTLGGGDEAPPTGPRVHISPAPGSLTASPQTQISIRGATADELGKIEVSGADSGDHKGELRPHADGRGASLVLAKPFEPGEEVTVRSNLRSPGVVDKEYRFTVAKKPAKDGFGVAPPVDLSKGKGEVLHFRSRPDLEPPGVKVLTRKPGAAPGQVFLAPKQGRGQDGPMIIDDRGQVVWFQPLTGTSQAANFNVQRYKGRRVLTWWQGRIGLGQGRGEGIIADTRYKPIAHVQMGNGYTSDLHEFALTPRGTALLVAYSPVPYDMRPVGGSKDGIVIEGVIQEVEIATGLVLFEWHSLDHVDLQESYYTPPKEPKTPWDYFHVNSVSLDRNGDLLVSARHTFAIYEVDRESGDVSWRLGGKQSDFDMGPSTRFAWQHEARRAPDGTLTIFDNSHTHAAPPPAQKITDGPGDEHSRAISLRVDVERRTATLDREVDHGVLAEHQGGTQMLSNGNLFVGWGQQPFVSEYGPDGELLFDAQLAQANDSYRAYRMPWSGRPTTAPRAAVEANGGDSLTVYASWNGAVGLRRWEVLAGRKPGKLETVTTVPSTGFETKIDVKTSEPYVAVRAFPAAGAPSRPSKAIRVDGR